MMCNPNIYVANLMQTLPHCTYLPPPPLPGDVNANSVECKCNWSHSIRFAKLIARTTASLSTVQICIFLYPCLAPSAACNIILESASSCLQGEIGSVLSAYEQLTSSPLVIITNPGNVPTVWLLAEGKKERKSSVLLPSSLTNCCQYPRIFFFPSTRIRMLFVFSFVLQP